MDAEMYPGTRLRGEGPGIGANLVWRGYTDLWLVQFSIWCKHVSCIIISKCLGSILIPPAVGFLHIVSTHTLLLHKFIRPSTFHQTSIYIDLYHLSYGHSSPTPGTLLHQLPTQGVVGIGCHAQRTLHFQLGYWCRWKKPILSVNTVDTCTGARGCQERLTIDYAKLESMQIQYMKSIEINVWTSMSSALKSRSLPLNANILPHLSTKIRQKKQGCKFNMFHLWGRFLSSLGS